MPMYYIYIVYSASSDKYYIGYTSNPDKRLEEHNTVSFDTYTNKYRPWIRKALFECGTEKANAMKIEKFIKKQKSRRLIELLLDTTFVPNEPLAQLFRVTQMRD